MEKKLICQKCDKRATWVRLTQFMGDHPFCTDHAKKEENFGKEDLSYFCWVELPKKKEPKKKKKLK